MFVKWLTERVEGALARKRRLKRFHVLFAPVSEGPRAVSFQGDKLVAIVSTACTKYDLLVIDEAHHMYCDKNFRAGIAGITAVRQMLLLDVPQGLTNDACFPDELIEVVLTEVVRSFKWIAISVSSSG